MPARNQPRRRFSETDLYPPVKQFLLQLGYDVRAEVQGCDVVAVRGEELVVVELKLGVTLPLLVQAVERQRMADDVYVAIPKPRLSLRSARWAGVCRVLRRLRLGLLLVDLDGGREQSVEVAFAPTAPEPRKQPRLRQAVIREARARSGDYNVGGSHGAKLATAYREQAIHIACYLEHYGELSPKALRQWGTCDKTAAILYQNYYGWFERAERGIYRLTPLGRTDLAHFESLTERYREAVRAHVHASTVTSVP